MEALLRREEDSVRSEWNHSCTSQCPIPCPALSQVVIPEIDAEECKNGSPTCTEHDPCVVCYDRS